MNVSDANKSPSLWDGDPCMMFKITKNVMDGEVVHSVEEIVVFRYFDIELSEVEKDGG